MLNSIAIALLHALGRYLKQSRAITDLFIATCRYREKILTLRETRIAIKYRPISSNTDLYVRINNIYGSFTDEINAYVYTQTHMYTRKYFTIILSRRKR